MNGDGYRGTWGRVEKTMIMLIEITFSLPGSFFFNVMIPLNFIHFDHPSTSTPFFLIKGLDRMLLIRKIGFHEDLLLFNSFRRNSDAFLELRYMKHIMDCG